MCLNWYRSWPTPSEWAANGLDDKEYVVDKLPKILMSGQNYKTVSEHRSLGTDNGWPDDKPGFCLLEWDVALDPPSRDLFAALALMEPREILVAPYRWHDTWICWRGNEGEGPTLDGRPVRYTDAITDSFGFGCIYFPNAVINEFLQSMNHLGFTDHTFGTWYHKKYGAARITWEVHPQHVHTSY